MATLLLNGTARELRLDWRAIRQAERLMPRSVLEVSASHGALFKLDELVTLIWAGRGRQERTLTLEAVHTEVEAFLTAGGGLPVLNAVVTTALMEAGLLGRADEDESRPPEAGAPMAPAPSVPS